MFLTPPLDQPYRDQWAFLASGPRVGQHDVAYIVRGAAKQVRVIGVGADWLHEEREDGRPWELRPSRRRAEERLADHIPASVGLVISHRVFIPTEGMSAPLVADLRRMAAFQNPEFYAAQRMRLPTFGKPRVISCGEDFPIISRCPADMATRCANSSPDMAAGSPSPTSANAAVRYMPFSTVS